VLWRGEEIARLEAGEDLLKPSVVLMTDEHMSGPDKDKVQERLNAWIAEIIGERLKPLVDLAAAKDVAGLARGIAFRLSENLGILRRDSVSEEVRALDQPARAQLRGYGVRFGAFNIYFPALLKPAAVELALTLWLLKHGGESGLDPANPPTLPRPGLTSLLVDKAMPSAFYRVAGFHPCGVRAVRIDMLERLADQIRPLVAWRPDPANAGQQPPKGATGDGGFRVTPDMMSILGCSSSNVGEVLQELGFRLERVPVREREVQVEAPNPEAEAPPAAAPAVADATAISGDAALVAETANGAAVPVEAELAASEAAAPILADAVAPRAGDVDAALATGPAVPGDVAAPTAEAAETPAAKAKGSAEAKAEEPRFEEIWRPRRQGRHHDRERGRRRGGPPAAAGTTREAKDGQAAAAGSGQNRENGQRRGWVAREDRPRGERSNDRQPSRDRSDRPEQRRGERQDRQGGRPDRRSDRKDRRHGGPGGHREERQPRVFRASASPPKTGIDPDSPFAALSQLKAALEKQSQE
jgi:ATP-dependent RNA helicase SUPV3L1/SUV3